MSIMQFLQENTSNKPLIQANLYGPDIQESIKGYLLADEVRKNEIDQHMSISIEHNGNTRNVIIKEIQKHPVNYKKLHIDLYEPKPSTKIRTKIPLKFINHEKSPGLKLGGTLNISRRTVDVHVVLNAKADNIPHYIEVDTSNTSKGHVFKESCLKLPSHITLVHPEKNTAFAVLNK